jgi:hypothetical protein
MLLFVLIAFGCYELVSTFKVLTWHVMPDCWSCRVCLLVEDLEVAL